MTMLDADAISKVLPDTSIQLIIILGTGFRCTIL